MCRREPTHTRRMVHWGSCLTTSRQGAKSSPHFPCARSSSTSSRASIRALRRPRKGRACRSARLPRATISCSPTPTCRGITSRSASPRTDFSSSTPARATAPSSARCAWFARSFLLSPSCASGRARFAFAKGGNDRSALSRGRARGLLRARPSVTPPHGADRARCTKSGTRASGR